MQSKKVQKREQISTKHTLFERDFRIFFRLKNEIIEHVITYNKLCRFWIGIVVPFLIQNCFNALHVHKIDALESKSQMNEIH